MKKRTTITVNEDVREELMLYKVRTRSKSMNEVIKKALKMLKKKEKLKDGRGKI